MQYINQWPDMAELDLPDPVAQDLFKQLLEPFDSESSARDFWKETFCTLIVLNKADSLSSLAQSDIWEQLEFILTFPEYTEPLPMNYQLLVAIVNDSGTGIFLVIPPELSLLISEKQEELNNNL